MAALFQLLSPEHRTSAPLMVLRFGATEDTRAALSRIPATSFSLKPVAVLFPHLSTSVVFDTVGKIPP